MPEKQTRFLDLSLFHPHPCFEAIQYLALGLGHVLYKIGLKRKVSQSKSTDSKLWMLSFSIKSY